MLLYFRNVPKVLVVGSRILSRAVWQTEKERSEFPWLVLMGEKVGCHFPICQMDSQGLLLPGVGTLNRV